MNSGIEAANQPPGGYGPPGGGGYGPPPGGGGYGPPPGGGGYGPPGGGGYGPPGGGGFGGPPGGFGGPPAGGPPGGFGGPPGGFGGPPQGGYGGPPAGPPGGFGGPPGGFNGMPPQGQKPSGNGGLVAGIGIGCLLLLGGVGFGVYSVMQKAKKAAQAVEEAAKAVETAIPGTGAGTAPDIVNNGGGNPKAELKDPVFFRMRNVQTLHLVGTLENTGTSSVSFPSSKVTLFDAGGTAVDSGMCMTLGVKSLPVGSKVPCWGLFTKTTEFKTYKIEPGGNRDFLGYKLADLEISDLGDTAPTNAYAPYKITGKVTNKSAFEAKGVFVAVALFDDDGKICGVNQAQVAGNDLAANAAGRFEVSIYNYSKKPKRYEATPYGYDK